MLLLRNKGEFNLNKILKNIIEILFALITIYLIIIVLIENNNALWELNPIIVIICTILFVLVLFFTYYFISKKKIKHKKYIVISMFIVIIFLQLIATKLYKVEPDFRDFKQIYNEAKDFDNNYDSIDYFCMCQNNIPVLIIFKLIFKICKLIGITNFLNIGIIINILTIDISIYLLYKIINKHIGEKQALMSLVLFFMMPTTYLYAPIFYTDTLSMIFPVLILYLYLKIKNTTETNKNKIALCILLGITVFIGINIKFTILVIGIAICILEIFLKKEREYSKIFKYITITTITLLVLIFTKNILLKTNFKYYEKMKNDNLPATHFIMMALQGDGRYSEEDVKYTTSFKTHDEKVKANIDEIKNRIQEHNTNRDWIEFLNEKVRTTWGDGTFYAPWLLNRKPVNEGIWHEYVLKNGENVDFYKYYEQGFHIAMLIYILISLLKNKDESEETNNIGIISRLCIIGLFIIFLIWEAKSRYIFNYITIFVLIETIGISKLVKKYEELSKKGATDIE